MRRVMGWVTRRVTMCRMRRVTGQAMGYWGALGSNGVGNGQATPWGQGAGTGAWPSPPPVSPARPGAPCHPRHAVGTRAREAQPGHCPGTPRVTPARHMSPWHAPRHPGTPRVAEPLTINPGPSVAPRRARPQLRLPPQPWRRLAPRGAPGSPRLRRTPAAGTRHRPRCRPCSSGRLPSRRSWPR